MRGQFCNFHGYLDGIVGVHNRIGFSHHNVNILKVHIERDNLQIHINNTILYIVYTNYTVTMLTLFTFTSAKRRICPSHIQIIHYTLFDGKQTIAHTFTDRLIFEYTRCTVTPENAFFRDFFECRGRRTIV